MAITNLLTFELGYKQNNEEVKLLQFSVYYDKAKFEDQKEVAIDHSIKIQDVVEEGLSFKRPIFRTFRVIADRVPSDLGMR